MVRPGTLTSRPHHEGGRVSLATRKRYHTALGGLASRLVKRGLIDEHFIRDTGEDFSIGSRSSRTPRSGGSRSAARWTVPGHGKRKAHFTFDVRFRPDRGAGHL